MDKKRHFTKEHNELSWLIPKISSLEYLPSEENAFDWYEKRAFDLFEAAHEGQETFTKEDVIDAFMKGASEAYKDISYAIFNKRQLESMRLKSYRLGIRFGKGIQ